MSKQVPNRRRFLKQSALLSGGLLLSFTLPADHRRASPTLSKPTTGFSPNAFLHISPSGQITVILTKVEMGQGIWTTLPMLLAEELDADWKDIRVEHAPANKAYNHAAFAVQITAGSNSTRSEFERYRQAGATARMLLTEAAARRAGVAVTDCRTEGGYVTAGNQWFSYGELADDAARLPVPDSVPLRPPAQWKWVGKGIKRLDAPGKINGTAQFGIDVRFPGLLTAVVAHAPVFGGRVKSFDATAANAVPGVRAVVPIPTGVAVIADHFWAASRGRDALSIVWDHGPGARFSTRQQVATYRKLALTDGRPATQKGDTVRGLANARRVIQAEYVFPYLAHAAMEPLNCTVKVSPDHCEIWTGTQMPAVEQAAAAQILQLQPEQVTVNTLFMGGSFGRRAVPTADFVSEAVHIAKASGLFIKLIWTREDDMKGGYYRPLYVHRTKVGLDGLGRPVVFHHTIVGQSIMADKALFKGVIQKGIDLTSVEGVVGSPYLGAVPDQFIGLHTTEAIVPVLWFRSVGNTHTAYVMETLVDELAHAAGQDPVAYRMRLLKDHPRHRAALTAAVRQSGWGKPLPKGHNRGVAVHESFGSYVAQVVEISMVKNQIRVHRVTCAIDCGLAVNPDGVRAQMEGGILFGLTMALYGELRIEQGRPEQSNFHDYRMVRMNEAPAIDIHIVDSTEPMGGAGECGVPPLAPALANAIFAATGRRVRNLPLLRAGFTTV